jgi:hypothetical protein
MSEDTSPGAGILGFFLGIVLAGGSYFGLAMLFGASAMTAAIVGAVAAVIGAAYSAMAFSKKVYAAGFFSILGYLLDMTWSLLNTLAGFLVWIPAAKISGADFITPDDNSRRSGTFVYNKIRESWPRFELQDDAVRSEFFLVMFSSRIEF